MLWAAYGRTLTRLLPGRTHLPLPPAPAAPVSSTLSPPALPPPRGSGRAPAHPLGVNTAPAGLDKATWKKFRDNRIRAEARLDLHGHTATHAHTEVRQFLSHAHVAGLRCVEIITGNGAILARELPHWLDSPPLRALILAVVHPHKANSGALRILLRRTRA